MLMLYWDPFEHLTYSAAPNTPDDPCGEDKPMIIRLSENGEVKSPNYPQAYDDNSNCQWRIEAEVNHVVKLGSFAAFDLEDG